MEGSEFQTEGAATVSYVNTVNLAKLILQFRRVYLGNYFAARPDVPKLLTLVVTVDKVIAITKQLTFLATLYFIFAKFTPVVTTT